MLCMGAPLCEQCQVWMAWFPAMEWLNLKRPQCPTPFFCQQLLKISGKAVSHVSGCWEILGPWTLCFCQADKQVKRVTVEVLWGSTQPPFPKILLLGQQGLLYDPHPPQWCPLLCQNQILTLSQISEVWYKRQGHGFCVCACAGWVVRSAHFQATAQTPHACANSRLPAGVGAWKHVWLASATRAQS